MRYRDMLVYNVTRLYSAGDHSKRKDLTSWAL
jgi:hypothetical protein